jgi:hypothetical protein
LKSIFGVNGSGDAKMRASITGFSSSDILFTFYV